MTTHIPEFSCLIQPDEVGPNGTTRSLKADEAELRALAHRLAVEAIASLSARLEISSSGAGKLAVTGQLHARVCQMCVVTLEPFETELTEPVMRTYIRENLAGQTTAEIVIDPESDDDFDILNESGADLGELVAETLALALEPYPRKPGVTLQDAWDALGATSENGGQDNPFAVLKHLSDAGNRKTR